MLNVLSYILCDLDPKVKVIGQKAGICDGVPSTSALVNIGNIQNFYSPYSIRHSPWRADEWIFPALISMFQTVDSLSFDIVFIIRYWLNQPISKWPLSALSL